MALMPTTKVRIAVDMRTTIRLSDTIGVRAKLRAIDCVNCQIRKARPPATPDPKMHRSGVGGGGFWVGIGSGLKDFAGGRSDMSDRLRLGGAGTDAILSRPLRRFGDPNRNRLQIGAVSQLRLLG